jgi:hypothetical protein
VIPGGECGCQGRLWRRKNDLEDAIDDAAADVKNFLSSSPTFTDSQ